MPKSVIDASTFAKWFINEPGGENVRESFIKGDLNLHTLTYIIFETCNVIWKRREIPKEKAISLACWALRCGLEYHQMTDELVSLSMDIARECNITFYDAVYLALAKCMDIPLITSDRVQGKAGEKIGIHIWAIY